MPKVALYNMDGNQIGELELSPDIFGIEINVPVMHQVVKAQLANKRQGTQSALTRAEVSGGGIKPWRQKGTGRARQGSIRSPQWTHGGVVFAPKPRDYREFVPKKVKRLAMKCALSQKVLDKSIIVIDSLDIKEAKTKEMAKVIDNFDVKKNALLIIAGKDQNVERATRNIQNVKMSFVNTLNVYDILKYDKFIITKDAIAKVEEVYA